MDVHRMWIFDLMYVKVWMRTSALLPTPRQDLHICGSGLDVGGSADDMRGS